MSQALSDDGVVLATALHRLARLRAQMRGERSEGPTTLPTWANVDGDEPWGEVHAPPPAPAPAPLELRGRFEAVEEPPLDVVPARDEPADELTVALAEDVLAQEDAIPATLGHAQHPGAAGGLQAFLQRLPAEPAPTEEPETVVGYGATPLALSLLAFLRADSVLPEPAPRITATAVVAADAFPDPVVAAGAMADLSEVFSALQQAAPPLATAPPPGPVEAEAATVDFAFGAAPLAALLDMAPLEDKPAIAIRPFDPTSLIDDALADAFDALLNLARAVGADDVAWDTEVAQCDPGNQVALAACEAALWALPRHVPCSETFAATPNHETAVRLTRALRLRAQALEARAFAEAAGFGALSVEPGDNALWFTPGALSEPTAAIDPDASLPDWEINAEGFVVVTAPDVAPSPAAAPTPLITEAELDALFARVEENQRVVVDDLGEDAHWSEPYWSDVDSYLAQVAETMDPALLDAPQALPTVDMYDIEVRETGLGPVITTHFWIPGDDDLVVEGDGEDLFIVGGGDAATILVEDGATWAMRTGGAARVDEIIVSLSDDDWTDIDFMTWRRIATLSRVAQVRVEQNIAGARRLVLSGSLVATGIDEDDIRLVRSGDDGEEDYPVLRAGVFVADWPFADIGRA